jgi:outer membrane receptor for Fe3+-dicitrate
VAIFAFVFAVVLALPPVLAASSGATVSTVAQAPNGNVPASPQVAPSPCPSSSPSSVSEAPRAPAASPTPCAGGLKQIGRVTVGRKANLVGQALSASTGTISQEQIATRPLLRPGEVLEDIPGLIISQHSGGGKANQYYLRGFQLDHGTNLEAVVNGVPLNLGSHAHGQGYSDINYLIPELVTHEWRVSLGFPHEAMLNISMVS